MAFLINEAFLPATLTAHPMTDEEFAEFCAEHPDLFFEMTSEAELIVMPPTCTSTGARNLKILGQLNAWAERDARGTAAGSSDGFVLPNGARRSPDAAWTSKEKIHQLSQESFETYWHLCPEFVVELKSKTDRKRVLREKMVEWIANGAQIAWLIDPETTSVEVYRPDRAPELVTGVDCVKGEGPVEGFVLDLLPVWDPLPGR
jgi:Uma2 family endonuclease